MSIVTLLFQFIVAGALVLACVHVWNHVMSIREDRRVDRERRRTLTECTMSAAEFLGKEGWLADPDAGDDMIYTGRNYVYMVIDRQPDPPKGEFDDVMAHLIRGTGDNTRVVAMVFPDTGDGDPVNVEYISDLTRYMRWTRSTGAIVLTDRAFTFSAQLTCDEAGIVVVHHQRTEVPS